MGIGHDPPSPEGSASLDQLSDDVRAARDLVAAERVAPVDQRILMSARDQLLRTMEAYEAGLTTFGLPIPRRLRDDLRLLRRTTPGFRGRD